MKRSLGFSMTCFESWASFFNWRNFFPLLFLLVLAGCGGSSQETSTGPTPISEERVTIARSGQALLSIVVPPTPIPAEEKALDELRTHLKAVTGAEFAVVEESKLKAGTSAIFLGQTRFARDQGIDLARLGEEESVIRTVGKSLILSGGRPRGTLYAVYEFLERKVGCHWLSWDTTVIPSHRDLALSPMAIQRNQLFSPRELYSETPLSTLSEVWTRQAECVVRNRGQAPSDTRIGGFLPYSKGTPHTFYQFLPPSQWFVTNPEYYSMNEQKKRTCGTPELKGAAGSSLCLSNPEVARIVAANIASFVDEEDLRYEEAGLTPSRVVDLSQEDNTPYICLCPDCEAITIEEGTESGLLIRFLNAVAELLHADHPDAQLRSLAYGCTDVMPFHVRPSDHVIIWWADSYTDSDGFRPLSHAFNQPQLEKLKAWTAVSPKLQIWDYWNFQNAISSPAVPEFVPVGTISKDVRTFRQLNVKGLFTEYEWGVNQQSFYELSLWAGMQLLSDPDLSEEDLISTFMAGYYGSAAPTMRKYHDLLQAAMMAEPESMNMAHKPGARLYVNMDFLLKCRSLLLDAEGQTVAGSPERMHVWQEMVVVYNCLLTHWEKLILQAGSDFPFTRSELLDIYANLRRSVMTYSQREAYLFDDLTQELAGQDLALPLPAFCADLPQDKVFAFAWPEMPREGLKEDPEAAGGKAVSYLVVDAGQVEEAPYFGIYDRQSGRSGQTLTVQPSDEQYHWYNMGTFTLGTNTIIWGHWSWLMTCLFLDRAYLVSDDPTANDWEVHLSIKVTGPLYVPGSTQENRLWVDRVILVKPS